MYVHFGAYPCLQLHPLLERAFADSEICVGFARYPPELVLAQRPSHFPIQVHSVIVPRGFEVCTKFQPGSLELLALF